MSLLPLVAVSEAPPRIRCTSFEGIVVWSVDISCFVEVVLPKVPMESETVVVFPVLTLIDRLSESEDSFLSFSADEG